MGKVRLSKVQKRFSVVDYCTAVGCYCTYKSVMLRMETLGRVVVNTRLADSLRNINHGRQSMVSFQAQQLRRHLCPIAFQIPLYKRCIGQ
jgi:hypothetical protein